MIMLIKIFYLILLLIFFINFFLNKIYFKKYINFMNNIECGFNNLNNKHMPMYNNFFLILIIFLIFDLEYFLLIPLIMLMKNFNWIKFLLFNTLTLMFIYLSMLYEIKVNSIMWIK